jgi:allophanate hydrolase
VPTTAGCPAFAYTPSQHATVVQKLLDAGASVLGKTNLDQFACGLNGTRSPYGAVPNAFDAALCQRRLEFRLGLRRRRR